MKWAKKIAAGMLAAALSLALLCGCSEKTLLAVTDKEVQIDFGNSTTRTLVWASYHIEVATTFECTNTADGTKFYVEEVVHQCYVGTQQSGTLEIRENPYIKDKDGQSVPGGVYSVNRTNSTYSENGAFSDVEKVLVRVAFSYEDYSAHNGRLQEAWAASRMRDGKLYYVEILKFDCGTAEMYYQTEGNGSDSNDLKYIEVYLAGDETPQAEFCTKVTIGERYAAVEYADVSKLSKAG